MSNIRTELARHRWQDQLMPYGDPQQRKRMAHFCTNCGLRWDEQERGSPPVTGCLSDIDVKRVGKARQQDYLQDDARLGIPWRNVEGW